MATKIRLQRHGRKRAAFFHIVAADSRAKRDGRFIEKLGVYNPNTDPAIIDINFERSLHWVQTGAELTDTARAILSYKGVLLKNHLLKGVKKGALTEDQVEERFNKWLSDKDSSISKKKDTLDKKAAQQRAEMLKAEAAVSDARAKEIEAKNSPEVEEAPAAEAATEEAPVAEAATEEAPVAEAATEEAPAAEAATEEAPVAEAATEEAPVAEAATEEAPAAEAAAEEAPKKEKSEDTPAE